MAIPPRQPPRASGNDSRGPVIGLAVLVGMLVSFTLGVLVGRAQRVEPEVVEIEVPAPVTTAVTGPAIEMIRPDGSRAEPAAAAPDPAPAVPASVPAPAPPPAAAPAPAAQPAAQPAPAPAAAARPAPAAEPPPPRAVPQSGRFTIQVAAFRDRESAERLARQLESRGYDAYVQRSEVAGKGTWYRVRVGSFNDRDEARQLAERIERQEGRSAYVTLR